MLRQITTETLIPTNQWLAKLAMLRTEMNESAPVVVGKPTNPESNVTQLSNEVHQALLYTDTNKLRQTIPLTTPFTPHTVPTRLTLGKADYGEMVI